MDTDFNYDCPHCGESFVGSIEGDSTFFKTTCEECGNDFEVNAFIEVSVRTEKA